MKVWKKTNKDKRDLLRVASKGDTFYGTAEVSRRAGAFEDKVLAKRFKVTHMHPLLGGPMVGSRSLESLLWEFGPLSDSKPEGIRGEWDPAPQVAGPLELFGKEYDRPLTARELRALENKVADDIKDRYGNRAKNEAKKTIAKELAGAAR
jgi:hypothetical protein